MIGRWTWISFFTIATTHAAAESLCSLYSSTAHYMGTAFSITVCTEKDAKTALDAISAALGEIDRVEKKISDWRDDTETAEVNRAAGVRTVRVGPDLMKIVAYSRKVSELSHGAFDITVGPLVDVWGFRRADTKNPPADHAIAEARKLVGYADLMADEKGSTIFLKKKGMKIDLGAVGKGYGVDRAGEILVGRGIRNFLVDGGGNLLAEGRKADGPWRMGQAA